MPYTLIEKTAMEMAAFAYEEYRRTVGIDPKYPTQKSYVKTNFEKFLPAATARLAQMLSGGYSEHIKKEIYEAFIERANAGVRIGNTELSAEEVNKVLH